MWMELQGKKATHDFLSLYNKDASSLQLQDSRPPPSQGLYLRTHDFLQLETKDKAHKSGGGIRAAAAAAIDINAGAGPAVAVEHVLPGGVGTYTIGHVSGLDLRAPVKPEHGTCAPSSHDAGNGAAAYGPYGRAGFALWDQQGCNDARSRGHWTAPLAAARGHSGFGSIPPARQQERKRAMESGSRSSRGFDDDDDDEDEYGRREGSSQPKEGLTVKTDRKSSDPSTPRSKHSATEQRRRSKINDRFQILRELIPHSDQKRDKASFLLEVIEYIRFLQEKVQKYETPYPGWNQENAWEKVYFRSIWKNAQNNCQAPGDGITDPSQALKNGSAPPGYMFSGKFDDTTTPVAAAMLSNTQNLTESDNVSADASYKTMDASPAFASKAATGPAVLQPSLYASVVSGASVSHTQQRLISDTDNTASQLSSDILNEQAELTIDEGTINVSSTYSQGLLTSLTQALQNSGIDLSQATISVQINLGKRAVRRPTVATSNAKDNDDPLSGNLVMGHSRVASSGEDSEQILKKRKLDKS